ncbi:replication factor C subunit 2/4, partial [Pancytospora epiphaga]
MRVRIKDFCMKKGENKLVILDECDSLTAAAQQALRRLMETTSTRFILICNQISELIEPVQSRCAILRFNRISPEEFRGRVGEICEKEGIRLTESGMSALEVLSGGDIRACLNCMQGLVGIGRPVDDEFLYRLNGVPNRSSLESIFKGVKKREISKSFKEFESLWKQKYESTDLMN